MRISDRSAGRNAEVPTDAGTVILKSGAATQVGESHLCADPMPNLAIEGFVEIIVARQGDPLFDSARRDVIWISRGTYSVTVAAKTSVKP